MKLLFENWRKYINERQYSIDFDNPLSIEEVIANWIYGDRPEKQNVHTLYPIDVLLEYRDLGQEGAAPGNFEQLAQHMKENGMTEPIVLVIGKNGQARIGEGNQRLLIAKQIGIKKVPVRFIFRDEVEKANKVTLEPVVVNKQLEKISDEDVLKKKIYT